MYFHDYCTSHRKKWVQVQFSFMFNQNIISEVYILHELDFYFTVVRTANVKPAPKDNNIHNDQFETTSLWIGYRYWYRKYIL